MAVEDELAEVEKAVSQEMDDYSATDSRQDYDYSEIPNGLPVPVEDSLNYYDYPEISNSLTGDYPAEDSMPSGRDYPEYGAVVIPESDLKAAIEAEYQDLDVGEGKSMDGRSAKDAMLSNVVNALIGSVGRDERGISEEKGIGLFKRLVR